MGEAKLDLSPRTLRIIAVIFAAAAVLSAADVLTYRIRHRNCTEEVLAHAGNVERTSGRNGMRGRGYTYTVDYSYEYNGTEYSCEGIYIEDTNKDINIFYADKEIRIDPDAPDMYVINGSADGSGLGFSLLLTGGAAAAACMAAAKRRNADK